MTINFGTATTKKAGCTGCKGEAVLMDMNRTVVLEMVHGTARRWFRAAGSLSAKRTKIPTGVRSWTTKLNEHQSTAQGSDASIQASRQTVKINIPGRIHSQLASVRR